MIHVEGAARTTFIPLWAEHEAINDKLASGVEEIGDRPVRLDRHETTGAKITSPTLEI
jgi:hypothetical protein